MSSHIAALLVDVQRIARDPARKVFALVDGARFDDFPGVLAAAGICHRPLYRNVQEAELVRAGPWLIDPYRLPDAALNAWGGLPPASGVEGEEAVASDTRAALNEPQPDAGAATYGAARTADADRQLETVIQIAGDAPAAVFWIGDAGLSEAALWRHLRTLNMVLIPKEYNAPDEAPSAEGEETHEAMMFRHGDGNVLAEVLPVLDAAQFSRVFGPAKALMFLAPDHPGPDGSPIRRAVTPADAPPGSPGLLKLSAEQYAELTAQRVWNNRRFTMDYLRDAAPEETAQLSDEALYQFVTRAEKSGFRIGLESDYAHGLWAFMLLAFGESIANNVMITGSIRQSRDPDNAVEDLLNELSESASDSGDGG
jgi:hypothetical protein